MGNMKEKYTTPEMEIIEFEVEDIITASGDPDPDELPTIKQGSEEEQKGNKKVFREPGLFQAPVN